MKRVLLVVAVVLVAALVLGGAGAGSPQAKPTLRALAFHGLDRDVVGRLAVGGPNGERDGHFTAVLTTGRGSVLKDVVLQRVFASGSSYAEGWDTNPGTSASILGVSLDRRRLNPTDRALAMPVRPGRHVLEVFANDHYGVFAPGQYFRLTAVLADSTASTPRLRLPGARPTLTAQFAGIAGDVAGRETDQKPNGEPDGHFVVRLDTHGSWQIVTDVTVRRLNAQGAPDLPIYHLGGPQTAGLLVDGHRVLWPTELPWWSSVYIPIDPKASPVRLDVYANDPSPKDEPSGYFGPGQQYRVSVQFTDSQTMNAETFADVRL